MLWIGIVGSYGNSVSVFLRNFHNVFHSGCNSFHSTNSVRGFHSSPHPLQHLLFINCFMMAILIGMRWYLIAVSICLSLLMSNAEHLFICLLAICVSSLNHRYQLWAWRLWILSTMNDTSADVSWMCFESNLTLLVIGQNDEVFGQGIVTLFGKPADQKGGELVSQRIILSELDGLFLEGVGWSNSVYWM